MAIEKKLAVVEPLLFTANGSNDGTILVSDTINIKVYASVVIKANSLPNLSLQVKVVKSSTELVVGPRDNNLATRTDLTAYTTGLSATIEQPGQTNLDIPFEQWQRSTYEQEPTLAVRNVLVDPYGNFYNDDNPFPIQIDGDIKVGSVNVDITDKESSVGAGDYDIIRIGDGVDELEINGDGTVGFGNTSGVADFNNGPTTTQTLRTTSNISDENGDDFTDSNYLPVGQSTHDNLNLNANVQQNDTDVSGTNPLYTQTTNGSLESTQQAVLTELQSVNTEIDGIHADLNSQFDETQTILQTEFDETQVNQVTQINQLTTINESLNEIESDTDAIRIAVQSIDSDFDVALSTRASELTQQANNLELQGINSELDVQTVILTHIDSDLHTANNELAGINSELDSQTTLLTHIDSDLHDVNSELDGIHTDLNAQFDETQVNQVTQINQLTEANESLNAIEEDSDLIRIAVQSIAENVDTTLSGVATEVTQLENNQELKDINSELDSIHTDLNAEFDETQTILNSIDFKTIKSIENPGNSTTIPLIAAGVFTGAWVNVVDYAMVTFTIFSDVASVTNGLSVQWGPDGTNVDRTENSDLNPGSGRAFALNVRGRYFRIVYTNGANPQTAFRLATDLHVAGNGIITRPLTQTINDSNFAQLVTSVITGKNTTGQYIPHRSNSVSAIGQNSSTTPLGAGATYVGQWEDVLGFANAAVTVISDVPSANDGLSIEFSTNGIDVDDFDLYTISANNGSTNTIGVTYRYFRVRYTNGSTPQTSFRLSSLYSITAQKPSSHRIDDAISGQNDAELSKSVQTAKTPDDVFINLRAQGINSANMSAVPLDAGGVFRGEWFDWSEGYVTLISSMEADTTGTIYVDFSDQPAPVNGSDVSISHSISTVFDADEVTSLRLNTPLQSLFVRHRYVNGAAAQTMFRLTAIFTTTDPGAVYVAAGHIPTQESLVAIVRSVGTIPDITGTGYQDIPVDNITGNPKTTVSDIRDDILLRPLSNAAVAQIVIGTTPVRIDPTQVANRRSTLISNDGPTTCSVGFSSGITFDSASMRMTVGAVRVLPFPESVQYWAVAQNTGGTQTVLTRSGSTATGTGTTPSNALTSNNVNAIIAANAQTVAVNGFTAGTTNPLVSVKIGAEMAKQASQFETVAFVDVVTGSAGNTGTIVSGTVTANANHKYFVAISWKKVAATITGVTGMGATWTLVAAIQTGGLDAATAVYTNTTEPTTNEAITATFSTSSDGAVIGVSRYSGVDLTTPIQAFETVSSDPATASYSDAINGTNKGMLVTFVGSKDRTQTAGSGATERHETSSTNDATLTTNTLALTSTASTAYSGTFSGATKWSLVALTLLPAPAVDPQITLSYELSAVPGATTGIAIVTNTVDTIYKVDITADRAWVVADVPNIKIITTGTVISAAAANIDHIFLELTDTTGAITRLSVVQGGEAVV